MWSGVVSSCSYVSDHSPASKKSNLNNVFWGFAEIVNKQICSIFIRESRFRHRDNLHQSNIIRSNIQICLLTHKPTEASVVKPEILPFFYVAGVKNSINKVVVLVLIYNA